MTASATVLQRTDASPRGAQGVSLCIAFIRPDTPMAYPPIDPNDGNLILRIENAGAAALEKSLRRSDMPSHAVGDVAT